MIAALAAEVELGPTSLVSEPNPVPIMNPHPQN